MYVYTHCTCVWSHEEGKRERAKFKLSKPVGGGVMSRKLLVVAPGTLASAMLIARQGSAGLVSHQLMYGKLKLLKRCH